jgi:hypothetical protein
MAGKDLDALAKELADERISRGQALRRMVGVLLGGVLAATPAAAFAAQPTKPTAWCISYQVFQGLYRCDWTSKGACEKARQARSDTDDWSKCFACCEPLEYCLQDGGGSDGGCG